jgi:hypothetical protein
MGVILYAQAICEKATKFRYYAYAPGYIAGDRMAAGN